MKQPSIPIGTRLSSKNSVHLRWMLPTGFLILIGLWILFADLSPGEWEKGATLMAILFFVTLWAWNRVSQEVEVWIHGDRVRIHGHSGTVDLGLNEVKRVRIIEQLGQVQHIDDEIRQQFHFSWERRWRHHGDRVEVEFEDMSVLGKRVVFRLDRVSTSERPDRDPQFVRWMKAVNRQNSDLDEVELGKGENDQGAEGSADHPEESHDPIKRMRKLRRKR